MPSHCSDLFGDKNKYYFQSGRLFTSGGEADAVPVRKPGPAWSCVITRCLLATLLRASTTQEKCYLPETQDLSYLCNYKPRRKANNVSMPSSKSLLKAQRVEPSTEKSSNLSHPSFNRWTHQPREELDQVCLLHGEILVTKSTATKSTERRKSWWLEIGGLGDLNQNNYSVEAKICTTMPNTKTP